MAEGRDRKEDDLSDFHIPPEIMEDIMTFSDSEDYEIDIDNVVSNLRETRTSAALPIHLTEEQFRMISNFNGHGMQNYACTITIERNLEESVGFEQQIYPWIITRVIYRNEESVGGEHSQSDENQEVPVQPVQNERPQEIPQRDYDAQGMPLPIPESGDPSELHEPDEFEGENSQHLDLESIEEYRMFFTYSDPDAEIINLI
ncbi:UNVERIFIED_CONTAM: hypothetical protein RMT77_001025 [Armadillidium vulgare]